MTEDEAKTRWCPFARVAQLERAAPSYNRLTHDLKGVVPSATVLCMGSDCMAWRWDEPWTSQTEEGSGGDIVVRLKRKPGEPRLGYCGLAGAPQ